MKHLFCFVICCISMLQFYAQDSIVKHTIKINEIVIFATAPIIPLYNYSSKQEIILSALNNDDLLNDLISNVYTDTSNSAKTLRPRHPSIAGANVGVSGIINLADKPKNKFKRYIPVTLLYESHDYMDYFIGKTDIKRLDTIVSAGATIYLDSITSKAAKFRFETQSLFIQSGVNIESGNQYLRFSTGLNIGLGIGFKNTLKIVHQENSYLQSSNLDNKYFQSTYYDSGSKIQKVKPVISMRLLVPFCVKINFKKSAHYGVMAQISSGFEMDKVIKSDLLVRWLLFCSFGVRYRFS